MKNCIASVYSAKDPKNRPGRNKATMLDPMIPDHTDTLIIRSRVLEFNTGIAFKYWHTEVHKSPAQLINIEEAFKPMRANPPKTPAPFFFCLFHIFSTVVPLSQPITNIACVHSCSASCMFTNQTRSQIFSNPSQIFSQILFENI